MISALQDIQLYSIVLLVLISHETIREAMCAVLNQSYTMQHMQLNKYIQVKLWIYLEQLPFSCCMYASHLLKSLGYFSLQCHKVSISQAQHYNLHQLSSFFFIRKSLLPD